MSEGASVSHLADCVGTWVGSNGFRLMPTDAFAEGPAGATLSLAAGAHLTVLSYEWEHPDDGPQDGVLVFGPGADVDSLVALWGDSWHQQPTPMSMTGRAVEGSIEVDGEYAPGWKWRIVVRPRGPAGLVLEMHNVVPASEATAEVPVGPYTAMAMELRRG